MVCDTLLLVLPQASTAFQVLVNVFAQAVPPVTSETIFTDTAPQASLAVGAVKLSDPNVAVPGHPSTALLAPAAPIVGAVVSLTLMVCDTLLLVLPQASTAFQVLVNVFAQAVPPVTSETIF